MQAALAGRRDPDLVIAGRTSAIQITGIEDTIRRAKAYEAVGVDAIFLVGVKTRKELETIAPNLKVPIILGTATPELSDRAYGQAGRAYLPAGASAVSASVQAIYATLKALRDGVAPEGPAEPCVR